MTAMTLMHTDLIRTIRGAGFTVDNVDSDEEGFCYFGTAEATFEVFQKDGSTGVVMWSGAYPFANEHPMGVLPSLPEAVRYASWLLKREAFQIEREEARLAALEKQCYACDGTGKATQGWSGNPSLDGTTCPDCRGDGEDKTPYGTGGDHCAWCAADWKRPHREECVAAS